MLEKLLLSISTANGSECWMLHVKQKKIMSSVIARGDILFGAVLIGHGTFYSHHTSYWIIEFSWDFLTSCTHIACMCLFVFLEVLEMKNCVKCSGLGKYVCLKCAKPLWNKTKEYSVAADRDSPGWKAGVSVAYCAFCSEVAIPNARTKQATIPVKDSNPLSRKAQQRNNQCPHNLMAVKGNVLLWKRR